MSSNLISGSMKQSLLRKHASWHSHKAGFDVRKLKERQFSSSSLFVWCEVRRNFRRKFLRIFLGFSHGKSATRPHFKNGCKEFGIKLFDCLDCLEEDGKVPCNHWRENAFHDQSPVDR